jgi:2-methylcitrate dehydratase PrpD
VQCRCARDFIPSRRRAASAPARCTASSAARRPRRSCSGSTPRATTSAIALAASFAGSLIEGQRTGRARRADFAEAQPRAAAACGRAALAAEGFEGAATALEGDGGFYNAFTGNSHRGDLPTASRAR